MPPSPAGVRTTSPAWAFESGTLIGSFVFLLLLAAQLTAFDLAFANGLWLLRTTGDTHRIWGFLGVFPKSLALLCVGAAIVLAGRLGANREAARGPNPHRMHALALHIAAGVTVVAIALLLTGRAVGLQPAAVTAMPWLLPVALPVWVLTGMLVLAPARFWRNLVHGRQWELAFVLVATAAYKLATQLDPEIERMIARVLFPATTAVALFFDACLGYDVAVDEAARTLTIGSFTARMAPSCLGYAGIGLVLLFLGAHLCVARRELKFPNVLVVIPLALAAIWLLNGLRIALLMAIGASWSPAIALQGFHSAAGWVSLMAVTLASVIAIDRFGVFSKQPVTKARPLSDEEILLVPQLTLLAVALGTLLLTPSFEWLYPVRVVVVGAVLWGCRKRFHLGLLAWNPTPLLIGFAVFLVWVAAIPADAEKSKEFAATLLTAPAWGVAAWIAFRLVGAVVIVPIAEELAFRGFLQQRLEAAWAGLAPAWRQAAATLVSSLAFGALHGSWVVATLAGIAFAMARYHRGKLWDAIVAHATANLLLGGYVLAGGNWSYW